MVAIEKKYIIPSASKRRSILFEIYKNRISYLFIMPAFLMVLVFSYWPTFSGLVYSFTDWKPGIREMNFVGIRNYTAMTQDRYVQASFRNVLFIVIATLAQQLTIPFIVAELLFNLRSLRLQYWLRTAFVVPMILPAMAMLLLWVQIYDPNIGLLNQILRAVRLENWQKAWLGDDKTALLAIIGTGFPWVGVLPFLIYLGGLMSISPELYDAATVDGAGILARIFKIDLPLLTGQIKLLVVLSVINSFQGFYNILVMTGGGPYSSTTVPALEMYYAGFQHSKYGYACAIAVVLFVIIMTITILNMTYLKSSVEYVA